MKQVPVVDLAQSDEALIVQQVADACSTAGFFQVVNHGISSQLVHQFRQQCRAYFTQLPAAAKDQQRRTSTNARGYFDDELTKQRLDWKQALDVGVPGSRNWNLPDDHARNACLDGFNQFPSELPEFRETLVDYFRACEDLADRLARIMYRGIVSDHQSDNKSQEQESNTNTTDIVQQLKEQHTSYLRMNYYPVFSATELDEEKKTDPAPLGVSPHKDAGFLTVLLQDDDCYSLQVWMDDHWQTVVPVPGALTINTGDMAQIWSNGHYKAPLHRVLTNKDKERFSAPFFYNPGYQSYIQPVATDQPVYHPCLWGYFRAVRFAGDFTDLGVEIQIEDYEIASHEESKVHPNIRRQRKFAKVARMDEPFSVENFRDLLCE